MALDTIKEGLETAMDDVHMLLGTPRGKMKEEYLEKKYNRPVYNYEQAKKAEDAAELLRESRRGQAGYKQGGSVKGYSIDGIAKRGKTRAKHK